MTIRDIHRVARSSLTTVLASVVLASCGGSPQESERELPTLDVTHWTDKSELFMEYPALIAGQPALFAVHLTNLSDFSALSAGRARLELTPAGGGTPTVLTGPGPSRPGVFRVEGVMPAAGEYRWALTVDSPAVSDRHDLGSVRVFPDEAAAMAVEPPAGDPAAITYLKEPQWSNEFATTVVREDVVRTSVRAPATVHAIPGGEAIVAAPAAGRFSADALPSIGARVSAGQLLGWLEPRLALGPDRATLAADVAEAQAAVEAARAEQERAERLLEQRAVPARRVEDARRAREVAQARLGAAQARLAQRDETLRTGGGAAAGNRFALRAPIGGRVTEVHATLGASYEEGASLFRIVRTDLVGLEVQVPASDVALARRPAGVALERPGMSPPLELEPRDVHDAGVVDPATRALPLHIVVANPNERLLIGEAGTAVLYTRDQRLMPVVPSAAILTEAGRPYVFVQTGGEQFARRFVEIAARDGNQVGLASGVAPGERVVTRGAYEVQLASSATGLPAEGHVH